MRCAKQTVKPFVNRVFSHRRRVLLGLVHVCLCQEHVLPLNRPLFRTLHTSKTSKTRNEKHEVFNDTFHYSLLALVNTLLPSSSILHPLKARLQERVNSSLFDWMFCLPWMGSRRAPEHRTLQVWLHRRTTWRRRRRVTRHTWRAWRVRTTGCSRLTVVCESSTISCQLLKFKIKLKAQGHNEINKLKKMHQCFVI